MGRLGALTAAEARQRSAAWAVRAAEDLYDARYAAEVADLEGTGAAAVRAASDVGNTATMPFATFARRRAQELLGSGHHIRNLPSRRTGRKLYL